MVMLVMMGLGVYGIEAKTELGIWLKFIGVLAIAGAGLIFVFWLIRYAEKNPLHASLEADDLVRAQFKQWEIAEKGAAPAIPSANVPPPAPPQQQGPNEGAPQ